MTIYKELDENQIKDYKELLNVLIEKNRSILMIIFEYPISREFHTILIKESDKTENEIIDNKIILLEQEIIKLNKCRK